jgi:hypothetical protein
MLATLTGQTYAATPAFSGVNFQGNEVSTIVLGGGIGASLLLMLKQVNALGIFIGILVGLMVIFWLRLRLNKWLENVNPEAYNMRRQQKEQFRQQREMLRREYRSFRRRGKGGRRY